MRTVNESRMVVTMGNTLPVKRRRSSSVKKLKVLAAMCHDG